jgi:hypothetical protein
MAIDIDTVEKQARLLAAENRVNDPDITDVYWFPDEREVRLVEVNETVPKSSEEEGVQPFYFKPAPASQLPAPSGIALIRGDEVGKLRLPAKWGDWHSAVKI